MQGVMLGGWQLLWLVIRGEKEEGAGMWCLLCFVVSVIKPLLVFAAQRQLHVTLRGHPRLVSGATPSQTELE
jgi:hypothetical protein